MKKLLLVLLFAIALPLAARADSFGFSVGSGSLTYPPYAPPPKVVAPSFSASLGSGLSIQGVLPSWLNISDTGGNSFSIVENGVTIFQGVFTSDTVVRTFTSGGNIFQIDASIKGVGAYLGEQGALVLESTPVSQNNVFCRNPGPKKGGAFCNTGIAGGFLEIVVTPEPGTLGLLGTGLLGIAAVVRKRKTLRSRGADRAI